MRRGIREAGVCAGLIAGIVLGGQAWAQTAPTAGAGGDSKVHRLEIYNGPVRTVRYFGASLPAGEQSSLRDKERAENEAALAAASADQVQLLQRLYIQHEIALAEVRTALDPLLYGYATQSITSLYPAVALFGYDYPYYRGSAYANGSYGGYSNAPGYAGYFGTSAYGMSLTSGNEGTLQTGVLRDLFAKPAAPARGEAAPRPKPVK